MVDGEGGSNEGCLKWGDGGGGSLTLFQPGGGIHPPPGFFLAIATKINRSTPNFLTFNSYYRDII